MESRRSLPELLGEIEVMRDIPRKVLRNGCTDRTPKNKLRRHRIPFSEGYVIWTAESKSNDQTAGLRTSYYALIARTKRFPIFPHHDAIGGLVLGDLRSVGVMHTKFITTCYGGVEMHGACKVQRQSKVGKHAGREAPGSGYRHKKKHVIARFVVGMFVQTARASMHQGHWSIFGERP